ncbi:MAG: imidazole glycerol phosphate synthase subunit HisF [Alphaproteobacteria bacterium]|nr:MAG: imidazole glycerol phosphate synthase subunit HisF [Alphaproteobacteria bacterium]
MDITASYEDRETIYDVISKTAENCFIPLTVGGGVREVADFRRMLLSGADKVSINSAAVADKFLLSRAADKFGAQCVVLAIDAKINSEGMFEVYTHGGRQPTGIDALEWAEEAVRLGAGEILLTSMDGDGTKKGYDLPMLKAVCDSVTVPVIASGGAGSVEHFVDAVKFGNASAVLAASVFHFGEISISEVKRAMAAANITIRNSM